MASISRLVRVLHSGRTITKTLNPRHHSSLAPSPCLTIPLYNRAFEHDKHTHVPGGARPVARELAVHTILAGLLGFGTLNVAYADNNEASTPPPTEYGKTLPLADSGETPSPKSVETGPSPKSPPASTHPDLEEIARRDKLRLEALIRSKGHKFGSCPRFTVAIRGQKLTIRFKVPPSCEIPVLITNIVARLGVKAGDHGVGSDMMLRAWDSGLAWQLTLTAPKIQKDSVEGQVQEKEKSANDGELCILMFRPLFSADNAEIEFMKEGSFSNEELDALVSALELAGKPKSTVSRPRGDAAQVPTDKAISSLEAMGIKIYGLKQTNEEHQKAHICWDNIAGYDQQKREIEDTILLAIKSPEVYDDIARGTRCKFETNRPRAVLFDGPPGTGKTSCARIIANEGGVPLLYVPLEVIMSKYYGESERLLGKLFSLANEIPSGAIVFLDEVDSLATARDTETHEATRRLLSVLLRQIDGFEQDKKIVVVAATNRKQDLDPALLSRFDCMITFGLPDQQTREEIAAQYAKHLTKSELGELASATEEMSGRDIKDVCQQAERHWASKVIRGQAEKDENLSSLPPLKEYIECALKRRTSMPDPASFNRDPNRLSKKPQYDFM